MKTTKGVKTTSQYLTMRDGVRIAVDLHLPREARRGEKIPTIIRSTRYLRSAEFRPPFDAFFKKWFVDTTFETKQYFLARGYAWMDMDARGSGASFGNRPCPWSEDEVGDGADIVDWIIGQPWSNGRVGATGISYDGTTSEMLMRNRHPAVKAVIPQFCLYDTYTDVAFPGGVHQFDFTESWSFMNNALDSNAAHGSIGLYFRLNANGMLEKRLPPGASAVLSGAAEKAGAALLERVVRGVKRTDEDPDYSLAAEAIAGHAENLSVHEAAQDVIFRDDKVISPLAEEMGPTTVNYFSPHTYIDELNASGTAVFSYAAWWDMAYQHAAIKRHSTLTNPDNRLIIGPWDHGGKHYIGPSVGFKKCEYDHNAEFLRFFDYHLKDKDTGIDVVPPVRYYTMGEEKWKSADAWPPESTTQRLYFAPRRRLDWAKPAAKEGADEYRVDFSAGTGDLSRWKSGLGMNINYSDRRRCDKKLLCYDSAPLERGLEVTGHPVITLYAASTETDGNFFAYLEEVTPSGQVRYVTEGCLRAVHRKVSRRKPPYHTPIPHHTYESADAMPLVAGEVGELVFDLLPTSYLFGKGNRIRIALAGADRHHTRPSHDAPPLLRFHRTANHPSHIALPVVESFEGC